MQKGLYICHLILFGIPWNPDPSLGGGGMGKVIDGPLQFKAGLEC